jgi:hypothetical protein
MDLGEFEDLLRSCRHFFDVDAVLVVATLGSTFFGGVDNVKGIQVWGTSCS